MTTTAELERIAERALWPSGSTDVVGVVEVKPGGRLPNGSPSGIGGETRYGAAFFDGLRRSPAIAFFERRTDADRLIRILKDGSTLRSGPRSVAALTEAGSAERGSVPSVQPGRSSVPRSRGRSQGTRPDGVPMPQDAGSPGAPFTATPAPGTEHYYGPPCCAACGKSFEGFPPSRNGQQRKTCDDACRQAYHRGHRAPTTGLVDQATLDRLSRLPGRLTKVVGRFWTKVDRSAGVDGCWPWTGYRNGEGYGIATTGDGKNERAHRIAYQLTHGVVAGGLLVCHRCDNPPCCNPRHLFEGSDLDNVRDSMAKGRFLANRSGGRGDPDPAPDPNQLAMSLGHTPAS